VRALKVMSSYVSENSIPPSCVRRLTMERIAKPHAYAPGPADLQVLAKCGRSPLLYDGFYDPVKRGRKQRGFDSGVNEGGYGLPSVCQAERVNCWWGADFFVATKVTIHYRAWVALSLCSLSFALRN